MATHEPEGGSYVEEAQVQGQTQATVEGAGYEVGEPLEGDFDLPEYVEGLRDRINEVREANQALYQKFYPTNLGEYKPPDPVLDIQYHQACDALHKEEDRLMGELNEWVWMIPPAYDPPHNESRLSKEKARLILHEGEVHGRSLTERQRGLFGLIASGKRPTRMKSS